MTTTEDNPLGAEPPFAGNEVEALIGSLNRMRVIEECSRHVGHADLIRESVDGLVGEDPPGTRPTD